MNGKIFLALCICLCYGAPVRTQTPTIEWQRCLGGTAQELGHSIVELSSGGYLAAGLAESNNGDVSGNHGLYDLWVVKLDPTGALIWQKALGGSLVDRAHSILETSNGGCIVAGQADSDDGDLTANHGGSDLWVVELDSAGNILWQQNYGGSGDDLADDIRKTQDGGYIIAGATWSNDGDVSGNNGNMDFWVLRIDSIGNLLWQKTLGGSAVDRAHSVRETHDGGFIVAGWTRSVDGDVTGNHGNDDAWLVKLDSLGTLVWQKALGGSQDDEASEVLSLSDGSFIVAGHTASNDGDVSGNHGAYDFWVLKLDSLGNLVWQNPYGGSQGEFGQAIDRSADGGFVVTGPSYSSDGDVSSNNGDQDQWIIKIDSLGTLVWERSMGGTWTEDATGVKQTMDGGYIVVGTTDSNDGDVSGNHSGFPDMWVVKLKDLSTSIPDPSMISLSINPNPAADEVAVVFGAQGELSIELLDATGRVVLSEQLGSRAPGIHKHTLQTAELLAGHYTVRVQNADGERGIKRLVVR